MKKENIRKLSYAAMLAALCTVATVVINIPIAATNGYINLGDCVVLLCGWLLGSAYGFAAAGIGSCLADIFLGYAYYAPATFVIKGLVALTAFVLYKALSKLLSERLGILSRFISAVCAEAVMVTGYYVFEAFIIGYGVVGAAASIPANLLQALGGVVIGTAAVTAADRVIRKKG